MTRVPPTGNGSSAKKEATRPTADNQAFTCLSLSWVEQRGLGECDTGSTNSG